MEFRHPVYTTFFLREFPKIFVSRNLRLKGTRRSSQNITNEGVSPGLQIPADAKGLGRTVAHPSSLRVWNFTVKVVRHTIWNSGCGKESPLFLNKWEVKIPALSPKTRQKRGTPKRAGVPALH
jgi:hypothetical protein